MNYDSFFYLEYPKDIYAEIKLKECKLTDGKHNFEKDLKLFKKASDLKEEVKKQRDKNEMINIYEKKAEKLYQKEGSLRNLILPFKNINPIPSFGFKKIDINIKKDKPSFDDGMINLGKKKQFKGFSWLMYNHEIYDILENENYCERTKKLYLFHIKLIYYLFEYLELNGIFFLVITNCVEKNYIEYIYLLSLLFKKVVLIKRENNIYILCLDFVGQQKISKEQIENIIKNKGNFCIEPKPDLENMMNFLKRNIQFEIKLENLLLKKQYNKYLELNLEKYIKFITDVDVDHIRLLKLLNIYEEETNKNEKKKMLKIIEDKKKKEIKEIEKLNKEFLTRYVRNFNILEIGMGSGVFTKNLIKNLRNENLIIIDENQKKDWNSIGIKYSGIEDSKKNIKLYEESSILCLPKILNDYYAHNFKIIFIHNFKNFDYMIYDMVFINKLICINGYLIIDKSSYNHVHEFIKYIELNYPFYKKIKNDSDLTIFQYVPISSDLRPQNFYSF